MQRERDGVAVEVRPGPPFVSILTIDAWEDVRTRVIVSPMKTLHAGLWEIVAGHPRGVPGTWEQTVLARARDLDLAPFEIYAADGIRQPDFLHEIPVCASPTFEEELRTLAATPPEVIRADLEYEYGGDVPGVYRHWAHDPEGALAAYVRALEAWWRAVLEPSWPVIAAALEAEVLRVARLLATLPAQEALRRVHPRLLVAPRALWVDRGPIFGRHRLGGRTLYLFPFAAGHDALMTAFDDPGGAVIAYGAAGVQMLLAGDGPSAAGDLVALLGEARSRIILQLARPGSTSELAATLGYAPSTVSAQLRALSVMGLVRATRHAKFVFYERTERAEGLVALYRA